jgi:hypothetical protein
MVVLVGCAVLGLCVWSGVVCCGSGWFAGSFESNEATMTVELKLVREVNCSRKKGVFL